MFGKVLRRTATYCCCPRELSGFGKAGFLARVSETKLYEELASSELRQGNEQWVFGSLTAF